MKFSELLKTAEDAIAYHALTRQAVTTAREALQIAIDEDEKAANAEIYANAAVRTRLQDKGHHHVRKTDGTIVVYAASDAVPEGWAAYHPIPGEED